jgi:hypothetical protein
MPGSTIDTPEALVAQARQQTGLSDFGPDGWQAGLERLLAAAPVDIGNDAAVIATVERTALSRLVNRLRIEQWFAENASEARHQVEGPVVIVGLPRSATTALQYLLAVDPQLRYQRRWELVDPVPPPDLATESHDPRRLGATAAPNAQHIATVDGPIEDGPALALDFHHQDLGLPLPTYTRWWRTADATTTYAYLDRVLRLLHSHRPPYRWLLKAPLFCFHLTYIAAQYPDARFLWTHRDPVVAMPSACSVVRSAHQNVAPSYQWDPVELGSFVFEHFLAGILTAMTARDALGEDRFCDIYQQDVELRPMDTVKQIYDFLGLELTDTVQAAMTRWTGENRRGSRGEHRYTPEEFGLTAEGIREGFRSYIERFDSVASSPRGEA